MVTNLDNKELALQFFNQIVDTSNSNPFSNGMTIFVDNNAHLALIEIPDKLNGRKVILTLAAKISEIFAQSQELIREKRKFAKLSFSSISGTLPQSELVSCLGAYGEGALLNSSLDSPQFEGGQIFILELKSTILDFAFKDEIIKDVGIPRTVLIVRTERVIKSTSNNLDLNQNLDSSRNFYEVKAMYAACVKGNGRIDDNTKMYFYPFSNSNSSNYGRICLGSVLGSDLLLFENQYDLDLLPIYFYSNMANTHELNGNFKSQRKITQRQLLLRNKNTSFDENELMPMNMTFKEYRQRVINSLYR